jgi:hypothetical protein
MDGNIVFLCIYKYYFDNFLAKVFWFFDFGHLFLSILPKPIINLGKNSKKVIVTIMLSFAF